MRADRRVFLLGACVLIGSSAREAAGATDVDSYEIIVSAHPFGTAPVRLPDPPAAATQPAKPQPSPADVSFTASLRLSYIRRSDSGGIRCGIHDSKSNWSSVLEVGEEEDGLLLIEADFEKGAALVRKGLAEQWLYVDTGTATPATPGVRTPAGGTSGVRSPLFGTGVNSPTVSSLRTTPRRAPFRIAGSVEPPHLIGEELEKHLEQAQMEAIRQGAPPLPIPLTKEMDDQLVKEGVLPPQP